MIVSTSVEPSSATWKFWAPVRYISLLRPEVKTFPSRIAFSDRKLRISPRYVMFNHLAGRWLLLPVLNSVLRVDSFELLLGTSRFSGRKLQLSQTEFHAPTGCSKFLRGIYHWIFWPEADCFYLCSTQSSAKKVSNFLLGRYRFSGWKLELFNWEQHSPTRRWDSIQA